MTGGATPVALPPIPVIEARGAVEPAVVSALAEPARLRLVLDGGNRLYTPWGVRLADARSRVLAGRLSSPYAGAVRQVEAAVGRPGATLMNLSHEWGCTSGAADDPARGGTTLLRTLDWPFPGLGRALVVVRQAGAAGEDLNVAWPGFVGVLTALAPGRFAAAINQPPLPLPGWGRAAGWVAARRRVSRSRAMPPAHLLRLACDTCADFGGAVALIRTTPVCLPAIFTLAGPEPGQALVIERTADAAWEPAEAAAANHWASIPGPAGRPRNRSSHGRREAMCGHLAAPPAWSLDWVRPPVPAAGHARGRDGQPAHGRVAGAGLGAHRCGDGGAGGGVTQRSRRNGVRSRPNSRPSPGAGRPF